MKNINTLKEFKNVYFEMTEPEEKAQAAAMNFKEIAAFIAKAETQEDYEFIKDAIIFHSIDRETIDENEWETLRTIIDKITF